MDLQEMVPLLADADMVTASPYHPRGQVINVPRWRLFLSRGLSWIYRRVLGTSVHTWTSCFRVCRRDKFLDMQMQHGGFLGVAEMLVRLLRRGGRVREYPTILESRLLGASKMKTIRTIRGHLGLLWQVVRGKIC
jgi:dolichol-phosphate mannosyltransferase